MKRSFTALLLGLVFVLSLGVPAFAAGSDKAGAPASKDFLITGIRVGNGVKVTAGYNSRKKTVSYYSSSDPEEYLDALAIAMILNSADSNRRYIALGRNSYALDMALSDVVTSGKVQKLSLVGNYSIYFKEKDGKFSSMETDTNIPYFYCQVLNYDADGNIKEILDASIPTQVFYEDGKVCEINPGYESNKLSYDGDHLVSSLNYTYLYNTDGRLNYIGKTSMEADDPDLVYDVLYNEDGSVKQFRFRDTTYSFVTREI